MVADTQTLVYDVEDFKVYTVATDTTGASPTFGTLVDVPGIAQVSLDPNIVSAELKGDGGRLIGFKSRIDRMNVSATYGQLDLDVLEVLTGETVTVATDASINIDTGELPKFRCVFQILDTSDDVGDCHVDLYICRLTGASFLSQSSDNFGQPTFNLTAFSPQEPATEIGRIIFHDVATAIT